MGSKSAVALVPIVAMVFVVYFVLGLPMAVLPLYVRDSLGASNAVVGIVAGAPFAAALFSRVFAGRFADRRGPKSVVILGLVVAAGAGTCNVLSLRCGSPAASVAVLTGARLLLGAGESFIITGALTWGLALLGAGSTGRVMSFVGTGLYAAFAVGAPAGSLLFGHFGFVAVAIATVAIPLVALPCVVVMRGASAPSAAQTSLGRVLRVVWMPGTGVALSGVGFGAVTAFVSLLYAEHGWGPVWLVFTALSIAFIVGRLGFGTLPDRLGGARVALGFIAIEACGQAALWLASSPAVAFAGVVLTGFGYSLVYPALGVEAIRRAPPEGRGVAMGAYTSFLDLSLGLSGPMLGLVATAAGFHAVFFASMVVVLASSSVCVILMRRRRSMGTLRCSIPSVAR